MHFFEYQYVPETGSTNNDLKAMLRSSQDRLFLCRHASVQTAGRGRQGRSFISACGGIYFSFTVPLEGGETNVAFLTSLAGLCTALTLHEQKGLDVKIKWPNDIYLGGRKICGILTELVTDCAFPAAVVGIGINNTTRDFPDEIKDRAAALSDFGSVITDEEAFVKAVVQRVYEKVYESRELFSPSAETVSLLRRLSYSIGRKAEWNGRTGVVKDINADGSVKIDFGDSEEDISAGEIVHFI